MSNQIRYDPLLVHYLARELDERLRGRACAAAPLFAADRVALLPLDAGEALRLELHPRRGWIRLVPHASEPEELDAVCEGVEPLLDERVLRVHLRSTDRFRAVERQLVVELHSNQWNALLVSDQDHRVLSVLWSRTAGARSLRTGAVYEPPAGGARFGAGPVTEAEARERWMERLGGAPPEERRRLLLRHFAYTGTLNAEALLGEAEQGGRGELIAAFTRWWSVRALPEPRPALLLTGRRLQPYPLPLPGVEAEPLPSLLAGMERVAEVGEAAEPEAGPGMAALRRRLDAAERRIERLAAELQRAGEAERMRLWGDLLLARKRLVPRAVESVRLQDWTGALVEVPLDPTLSATENADRWYEEARRRERADARIPELMEAARAEARRWREALHEATETGSIPAWALEAISAGQRDDAGKPTFSEEGLPYRRYRTSGGLEVRVGRSARDNDALTFGHSRPGDIWLHARSVPGSHVILRWQAPDGGAPPARDLAEAAGLAALFSKARSSSLVPVDWTRRKHVRKPRGAAPGAVIPQQVRTLFVEPDPELEARLRAE